MSLVEIAAFLAAAAVWVALIIYFPFYFASFWVRENRDLVELRVTRLPNETEYACRSRELEQVLNYSGMRLGKYIAILGPIFLFVVLDLM